MSTALAARRKTKAPVAVPPAAPVFVDPPLRSSRIAIVGFASETMHEAPWDDPTCEIWILNMLHAHVPRWDRLWEMHDRVTLEIETAELKVNMDHLGALQAETARPIYMIAPQPDIPCSVAFDIDRLTTWFGRQCAKLAQRPYFTSTFGYMLGWAIVGIIARRADPRVPEPDETIYVAGVEMLNGEEYAYQRQNAEMLIGYALGAGIAVSIPDRSALLENDGLYGYARSESLELLGRMRLYYGDKKRGYLDKADACRRILNQAKADWNTFDGAVQAFKKILADPEGDLATRATEQITKLEAAREQATARRDQAQADACAHEGSARAIDWVLSHLTYVARGGKVVLLLAALLASGVFA